MVAEARSAPVGKPPLVARNDSVRSWIVPVAAAAEKVDVDLGHLTGDAGCEGLSAPRRGRDADTEGPQRRVLLVDGRRVQQRDLARVGGQIAVGCHAGLEVGLCGIGQTAARLGMSRKGHGHGHQGQDQKGQKRFSRTG
jgi:hypothetical protein